MKANELMLSSKSFMADDWVNTPDGNGIIRLINAIDEKIVVRVMGMDCWFLPNVVSPVPLTNEILKRNGFRNNKLSHDEGDWYYNVNLEEVKGGLWINVVSSRNVLHGRKEFCGLINYVHELQHAMKLCGIEREIEL